MSVADLRREYTQGGLTEVEAGDDPLILFHRWFDTALKAGLPEPNAMTLATVTPEGRPNARTVLLKGLDHGFTFFTNYDSQKGKEILAQPYGCLVFLWDELERQVRISGVMEKVSAAESDDYYRVRPLGSRLGAWASAQSVVIPNREYLEAQHVKLMAQYPDGNIPRPPHWGGYRLVPEWLEFWQGRPSRLHDRIRFRKEGTAWIRERLAP